MKISLIVHLLVLLIAGTMYAQENVPDESVKEQELMVPYAPISLHKLNYIIFGNTEDQVKAQFAFKYEIFRESGFFLAYSQSIFWNLYSTSSPISEINLSPELFWSYGDDVQYVRLGLYEHKSNGRDGIDSRAWDRSYIQVQASVGNPVNVGVNVKGFYMWGIAPENEDIADYTGNYEAELFFRFLESGPLHLTDKEELYIRGGTGRGNYGFDFTKGWIESGFRFRMAFRSIQPDFYIQLFSGYGETLVGYDKENLAVRVGIILQ